MEGDTKARRFRNSESLESERVTRDMLSGFLNRRGFGVVSDERKRLNSCVPKFGSSPCGNGGARSGCGVPGER
jgi:hypothetical protein